MSILIAALLIVVAVVIAIAVAKLLFGVLVVAAGVIGAIYIWRRLSDDGRALTS